MLWRDVVVDTALKDQSHVMHRDASMDPAFGRFQRFGSGFF